MLDANYVQYIGRPLNDVELLIRADFFGSVVIVTPGTAVTQAINPARLQVHVDDQGVISRIVNG